MGETTRSGLQVLGDAFGQITTWMGNMVSVISSDPLYMLSLAIFAVGSVIGLGYRLIRGG